MNSTVRMERNQAFHKKDFRLAQGVAKNPISFFLKKPKSFLRVLKYLFKLSNNYTTVRVSAEVIAKDAGCSVDHVYDLLNEMRHLGLLNVKYRNPIKGKWQCNEYDLHPMFYDYDVRFDLQGLFWPLRYLHVRNLTDWVKNKFLGTDSVQIEYPQQKEKEELYKKERLTPSKRESIIRGGSFHSVGHLVKLFKRVTPKPTGAVRPFTEKPVSYHEFSYMASRKGKVMNVATKMPNDSPMKDSECLLQFKNLTSANLYGQIIMTAFHPKVLSHVVRKMKAGKGVGPDPYTVFFRNCVYYSNARGLPINRKRVRDLARKHMMPDKPNYAEGRERRTDDVKIDALWKENHGED